MKKTIFLISLGLLYLAIFTIYDFNHRDTKYLVRCNALDTKCNVLSLKEASTLTFQKVYGIPPITEYPIGNAFNLTINKGKCKIIPQDSELDFEGVEIDCYPLRSPSE